MHKFKAGDMVEVVSNTYCAGLVIGWKFLVHEDLDGDPCIRLPKGEKWYVIRHFADDFKLIGRNSEPVTTNEPEQETQPEPVTKQDVAALYAAIALGAIEASDFDVALEAAKALERFI